MSERLGHPEHERLQALVEESLDGADAAVVESHLATCARCRADVEELRSLFAMLSSIPQHAPGAGFADRVMARVRVRRPWFAWAADWAEWLGRLAPQTTRGWAVASTMVALPTAAIAALTWWIMSRPGVTPQGLWVMSTGYAGRGLSGAWSWLWARVAGSGLAAWATSLAEVAATVGRGGLGLGVVMFLTLTAASIWVLYQNLFRTEERRTDYASFVF